ncbi:MASE1 domain-containing protein [Roseateles cavernae]|uniref:MASE1 domain-containing protein n=1 Tax=Roseateles cavernae TaxID=3153578 RepID=UPI0032E3876F
MLWRQQAAQSMTVRQRNSWVRGAETATLLGLLVMVAALLGIASRPMGQLASFWPANALLLGLLLRFPERCTPAGWLGACLGYLAADRLTGSDLHTTLLLTAGNLLGVITGLKLLQRLPPIDRRLQGTLSVPYLLLVIAAASAMAALVGLIIGPSLLGLDPLSGWVFCFISELANYLAFLPAVLTLPERRHAGRERRRPPPWRTRLRHPCPCWPCWPRARWRLPWPAPGPWPFRCRRCCGARSATACSAPRC